MTDTDSANLASATVTISAGLTSGEDVLAATPSGAILAGDIVYTPGTGTLTITRSAPLATYQTVLRSVTYRNTNVTAPNTATRNITFSASDGVNASNSPIRQVQVVDNINTQNLPFTESFETDGRGTRYALDGRFTNGNAMFDRGQPAGITNLDGTFAIIAEDTLLDAAPVKAVAFLLNTAPFGTVNASVRLGALGGAIYDTGDIIAIEASVNGGAFTTVAAFRSTRRAAASPMALDTNNNGIGDGTQLSAAMQDFSFPMPAATTLGLRVRCQSNTAGERLIVDRIVVTGNATPTVSTPIPDVTVERRRGEWHRESAELLHRRRGRRRRPDLHRADQHQHRLGDHQHQQLHRCADARLRRPTPPARRTSRFARRTPPACSWKILSW